MHPWQSLTYNTDGGIKEAAFCFYTFSFIFLKHYHFERTYSKGKNKAQGMRH